MKDPKFGSHYPLKKPGIAMPMPINHSILKGKVEMGGFLELTGY